MDHMSPKARQAKGKARVSAYENLLSQEYEQRRENLEIYIPPGPRLGDRVIEIQGVYKGFGDNLLMENINLSIPHGSIVGIIGPNGAGKTTLLKLITGQTQADQGDILIGDTVQLAYVDQARDSLNNDKTVWEEISGGEELLTLGDRRMNSRAYVSSFNFKYRPTEKSWFPFRRRAQPRPSGKNAHTGCQCHPAR
jgi:ATPase subunit of ABC transporter with duplicated ATPase domains